ncbi:MAG: M1 family aminopeptidase [Candidatus Eisenbacteria bacterium]
MRARSFLLLAFLLVAANASARPVPFPPLPNGVVEEREEYDVAPLLSAWKAHSLARTRMVARPATLNQDAYDVRWYDLALTFTPATQSVAGTVTMRAQVSGASLANVELDLLSNMTVDAVTAAAAPSTFTRAGDLVTVALPRTYVNGETFEVTVTYHGNPTASGYFGFPVVNSRQLIWSLSEAYGARTWWPCKDQPADKADSVDVHFTVPLGLTTVSNGTLLSTSSTASTTTANWRERHPIATYLVSIASYPYTLTTDVYRPTPADSMPLRFWNYPESVAGYAGVQAKVKDMLAAYAARFGEYPFFSEKYGHAQFQFSGGMEHQTVTSLGSSNEFVVAHELMHQWWGDMITCRDFGHIWLNEGFATYGEALWAEATGGTAAYKADIAANAFYGPGAIFVADAANETRVFDSNLSYNKGSWVLHMLRHVLGDSTFFRSMRRYRTNMAYRSATTEDFRAACEAESGRDLQAFFQQWIYGEYFPRYALSWTSASAAGGYDVTVTLRQTQAWQLFTMPVDLTVSWTGGEQTFVVPDSLASQTFVLHVPQPPVNVQVDRDGWILKQTDMVVANPTFTKSVLLVNGVDWANYGTEITSAYTDKAFWGAYGVDFWDHFATPAGGYPATLPAPLGHGPVPGSVLGQYRNVIWIGNNFSGDLASWQASPAFEYLKAGGNLLLLSRMGEQFLDDSLRTYLGISGLVAGQTLSGLTATRPGLVNTSTLGTQSTCLVFDSTRTRPDSQLLFRTTSGFTPPRGLGVIRVPANGMGLRPRGGRFAFVSGRPYRWNHAQLQANVQTILSQWFLEPVSLLGADEAPASHASLAFAGANPASGPVHLRFTLPVAGRARLTVLDVSGRRVRTLDDRAFLAGTHDTIWNGLDDGGALTPAGLYWVRLDADGESVTRRVVRIR